MILQRRILLCRTPLDIPIALFLLSQVVASIHSLDPHISLWGYYSRFNGGLLSIISYILLYYAFVSNFNYKLIKRLLWISLASGIIVALWGLPSHFGHDPTCLLFRGTFDVSCWTESFQPKIRIFSTLGQPNWLAVYLAILTPIAIAFGLNMTRNAAKITRKYILRFTLYVILLILFFLDLLFTESQSGFAGLVIGLAFFTLSFLYFEKNQIKKPSLKKLALNSWHLLSIMLVFVVITFFAGQPISALNSFTFSGIKSHLFQKQNKPVVQSSKPVFAGELGGTDSGKIRLIVWKGAVDIWKHNPLFGTGVETFAFAYYQYRPPSHNLTSEWDFLYNKAHNEYLNYLATTGIFGLGSYLLIIVSFIFLVLKNLKSSIINNKSYLLVTALLASYLAILVSNFFGFSVVIVNIYFFLIPAFVLTLLGLVSPNNELVLLKNKNSKPARNASANVADGLSIFQLLSVVVVIFASFYFLFTLFRYWLADQSYAVGYNLDRAGDYQYAYPKLQEGITLRGDEPVFQDELANNSAILAAAFFNQNDATTAATLAKQAIEISNYVVANHPNNLTFWKTRTRIFYMLSSIDKQYLEKSLTALVKASDLAPTDAKISYNLGVLYEQNGQLEKAITTLEKTIELKPDYRDAYYALGLFYHEKSINKNNQTVNVTLETKAINSMEYILTHISTDDAQVKQVLESWK